MNPSDEQLTQADSDVIHLQVLGKHMICLNSVQAANDLLDKRGQNYCDRPRFTLFEVYVSLATDCRWILP